MNIYTSTWHPGRNQLVVILFLLFSFHLSAQLSWQRMPGPPGGFSYGSFTVGTGGKWLQRGSSIGVHESADGGQNWRWNALPTSIHTEAALYIGTEGHLWFFDRDVVMHSADNGRNWTEVLPEGSLWIDNNFSSALVFDQDTSMVGTNTTGILHSTDLGQTLTTVFPVAGGLDKLARNPQNGQVFSWKSAPVAGQINPVYRSLDNGLTWAVWQNDPLTTDLSINNIAFAPNGTVFLITNQYTLRSTDEGASWTQLTIRGGDIGITPTGRILIQDKDGLLTQITRVSDDNGDTWQPASVDLMRKFSVMPDGTIFAEYNFYGLYRSNDNGDTWQFSAYGLAHHIYPLRMHFYADNASVAVMQDGIFYSANAATGWEQRYDAFGTPGYESAILPDGTICIYSQNQVLRSIDRGLNWTDITPALLPPDVSSIYLLQADGVLFLLVNNQSVLRSEDSGQTWLDTGTQQFNQPQISPDGTFWAINYSGKLQKSNDRGLTWSLVTTPALVSFTNIFAVPSGTILLLGGGKIYRSTNGGSSWSTINQQYMNNTGATLANSAGHLFVIGEQIGSDLLLMSIDDGQTWTFVNRPQTNWASNYLFQAPDDRLWLASGDGVWRSTEPSTEFLSMAGTVGADVIENCILTFNEPRIASILVKSVSENGQVRYGMTDAAGYYRLLTQAGNHEVKAIAPNELWESCTLAVNIPAIPNSGNFGGKNIAVKAAAPCPRLEIDVAVPLLRRCFDTKMAVSYHNSGTLPAENARIELVLDPYLDVWSTSFPIAAQSGDTLVFDIGTVQANERGTLYLDLNVSCEAQLGQMHCTRANIFPDTFCSNWQGPVLNANMTCLGDSILLQIENTGAGNMEHVQKWQVWRGIWNNFDSLLVTEGNFQLAAGAVFSKKIAASGDPVLLFRVPQEQDYPYGSGYAQSVLRHCDGSGNTPYSYPYQVYEPSAAQLCLQNIGSFDPNDKTGFPEGIGAGRHIDKKEPLQYLIRFQNTGTDTAFTVVIRDTLSPLLNIETLQLGAASHAVQLNVRGENELVFSFENIMLPDSNINALGSQGFVQYSIQQQTDNPDGAVIRNRAGIYFDFNLPVLTNETWHTVGLPMVSGVQIAPNKRYPHLIATPNPFEEQLWVSLDASDHPITAENGLVLDITDPAGRLLRQQVFSGAKMRVLRGDLPAGLLFLHLKTSDGRIVAAGKVVAQ